MRKNSGLREREREREREEEWRSVFCESRVNLRPYANAERNRDFKVAGKKLESFENCGENGTLRNMRETSSLRGADQIDKSNTSTVRNIGENWVN